MDTSIEEAIQQSKKVLLLERGWDEEDALPIPLNTWQFCTHLLRGLADHISHNYATRINTPEINPCIDGSLDLSWKLDRARLLINVRPGNPATASYYGDYYNDDCQIKGSFEVGTFEEVLADWMQCLVE